MHLRFLILRIVNTLPQGKWTEIAQFVLTAAGEMLLKSFGQSPVPQQGRAAGKCPLLAGKNCLAASGKKMLISIPFL